MRSERPLLVVTGSAGRVGRLTTPFLREHYRLRLVDTAAQDAEDNDETVRGDIRDRAAMEKAFAGATAVVHLAGVPTEADFVSQLLPHNIEGTWAVFEAAAASGVGHVVFASTIQAAVMDQPRYYLRPHDPPTPPTLYGAAKVFGEVLGRQYADHRGLKVSCLRLAWVGAGTEERIAAPWVHRAWCGAEDLARLMHQAISSPVGYAVTYGVSPPATAFFDTSNPYGWRPVQRPQQVTRRDLVLARALGVSARVRRITARRAIGHGRPL